jgi:hypothetical protein
MFRSFLGVGLLASATALPFGQHSSSGESKRSLIGEVDALNVCQYRNITQEGIDGGLFGLPRSSSLQYVNSHNDEMQLTPLVSAKRCWHCRMRWLNGRFLGYCSGARSYLD